MKFFLGDTRIAVNVINYPAIMPRNVQSFGVGRSLEEKLDILYQLQEIDCYLFTKGKTKLCAPLKLLLLPLLTPALPSSFLVGLCL